MCLLLNLHISTMHTINMQKESSKLPKLLLVLLVATCSLFDFQASSNGLNGLLLTGLMGVQSVFRYLILKEKSVFLVWLHCKIFLLYTGCVFIILFLHLLYVSVILGYVTWYDLVDYFWVWGPSKIFLNKLMVIASLFYAILNYGRFHKSILLSDSRRKLYRDR